MTEPPLPNWFSVFGEGLQRQLKAIEDGQIRLETKADAIHQETQRTNGRVTNHDGRIAVLENDQNNATQERRYKGQGGAARSSAERSH